MKPETIQAARRWFADTALACIAEVESGEVKLPSHYPLAKYRAESEAEAAEWLAGSYDGSFTFRQRAHYMETGECRALLP